MSEVSIHTNDPSLHTDHLPADIRGPFYSFNSISNSLYSWLQLPFPRQPHQHNQS